MTRNHPSQAVTFADTGMAPERLYSTILNVNMRPQGQGGAKRSKGSARKIGRNFRYNEKTHSETKYRSSGGEARRQSRIMRNAEKRIARTNRRRQRIAA